MYYHIRLDMIRHDGRVDQGACLDGSFRSLHKALEMIKRDFSGMAKYWRIEDLTEPTSDILDLESALHDALLSTHQYIVLTFKDDVNLIERCDHLQFLVAARDENENPPKFAFSVEEELAIDCEGVSQRAFVDLFENPIDVTCVDRIDYLYKSESFKGMRKELFRGIVIKEKSGGVCLVFAGENMSERPISLGVERVDKTMIEKIHPSTPDGTALHGFIVRLINGDSLYLTFSIKSMNPTCGGKHSPAR